MERLEHTLKPYFNLLEPNPRAMKRLVNAYSATRALTLLAQVDIEQHQLALWTILNARWPQLADYLSEYPGMVEKIGQVDLGSVPDELKKLFSDEDVIKVVQGDSLEKQLNARILQRCGEVIA